MDEKIEERNLLFLQRSLKILVRLFEVVIKLVSEDYKY